MALTPGDRVRVILTDGTDVVGRLTGRRGDRVWVDQVAYDGYLSIEDARFTDLHGHRANKLFGPDEDLCADCFRPIAQAASKNYRTPCEDCGTVNAFRDPLASGTAVFLCSPCHVNRTGYVPSSRHIARATEPSNSRTLTARVPCAASKYGQCTGNVKPRGNAGGVQLCNAHKGGYPQ